MKPKSILKAWLPLVVLISAFVMLAYASVQQVYRQGVDDPQIQMAHDSADALNTGVSVEAVVPSHQVDISTSLSPFYVIFNKARMPVASSGVLDGEMPLLPDGVLQYTLLNGENRLTWEPKTGTRIAAVIVPFNDGYVLAGRNMREVEQREARLGAFAGVTWIGAMAGTLFVIACGDFFLAGKN
jgi:hypothetical protein